MNNLLIGIIVLILFTFLLFFAYFKSLQDFKEEKSKEKPNIMFLGTCILFVIIIIDLILQYKNIQISFLTDFDKKHGSQGGVICLLIVCFSEIYLFKEIVNYFSLKKRCTQILNVKCIQVKKHYNSNHHGSRNRYLYSPIWKGFYKNQELIFECNQYINKYYQIGQEEIIMFNTKNSKEYIDTLKKQSLSLYIILFIVFLLGTLFFLLQ